MPARITPAQTAKIIALRELGKPIAEIASSLETSERTVKRVLSKHSVAKGSLLDAARAEISKILVDDIRSDAQVQGVLTTLVNQVLAGSYHSQLRLQEAASRAGEITSLDGYLKLARAESASALSLKSNVDTIRSLLAFADRLTPTSDELPVLTIRNLTAEDLERIVETREEEALMLGTDSPDDSTLNEELPHTR